MTTEEKARAYDEALEVMRQWIAPCHTKEQLDTLKKSVFPELAESEEERIRSRIIDGFKNFSRSASKWNNIPVEEVIAYLEKQKEQKPVESISQLTVQGKGVYKICPRCKERMVRDDSMVYTSMPPQYRYECPKCGESECDTVMYDNPEMEEQKPAEWSNEEYGRLFDIEHYLDGTLQLSPDRRIACIDFLKSLRSQSHWKPSEEQMKALLNAEGFLRAGLQHDSAKTIAELYENLKKLM